jgi:prepilin peptidase CpaA
MIQITREFMYPAASLLCAAIGAGFDIKSRRVPNFLTLPAIVLGLLFHLAFGGWRQLLSALAAGLICGLIFLVFYLGGGMGAGDVKLITAVGVIAGLPQVGSLLILTALAGGVMAISLALYRQRLKETIVNVGALMVHHRTAGLEPHPELNIANSSTLRLPYAVAIAAGSALSLGLLVAQR